MKAEEISEFHLATDRHAKIKHSLKETLPEEYANIIFKLDEIGYDNLFIDRLLAYFKDDDESVTKFLSLLFNLRQKYNYNEERINEDFVKSSILEGYAFWFNKTKKNYPSLVVQVKNSLAKKQSVYERISYGFYIFEQALVYMKNQGVDKFSIIYDRTDFDKEKNFDDRIPMVLKKYYDPKLSECLLEWIDHVYVLNIGVIYRTMFEVYKAVKNKPILNKIKLLGSAADLKKYYNIEDIPLEYLQQQGN